MVHKDLQLLLSIQASPDVSAIRIAEHLGDEHIVVPMIILVEGVIHPSNADSPELALAEEFGRHPDGWNGRPIVLNHPARNGMPVSANSPSVLEDESFGQLFNTTLDEDTGKLKTEAWINMSRVKELGDDVTDAVERLQAGDDVSEVSTGLFVSLEATDGMFKGEKFNSIWRNIVPDHLAILPEGIIGACSVDDGCGAPRLNGATSSPGSVNGAAGAYVLNSGDSLTSTGISYSNNTDEPTVLCETCRTSEVAEKGLFKQLFSILGDKLGFKASSDVLSDVDTRRALESALNDENPNAFFYLIAVFTDHFVYETGYDGILTQRSFSVADGGVVALADDKVKVRPVTEFVLVQTDIEIPEEENTMSNAQRVQALIDNQATRFNEESREWLTTLSDEQLDTMEPSEVAPVVEPIVDPEAEVIPIEASPDAPDASALVEPQSAADYISSAPPAIQEILNQGLTMQTARRTQLVVAITSCDRNKFDEATLKGMDLSTLENLARLANAPDFSGQGAGTEGGIGSLRDNVDENAIPPMPLVFPLKEAV